MPIKNKEKSHKLLVTKDTLLDAKAVRVGEIVESKSLFLAKIKKAILIDENWNSSQVKEKQKELIAKKKRRAEEIKARLAGKVSAPSQESEEKATA